MNSTVTYSSLPLCSDLCPYTRPARSKQRTIFFHPLFVRPGQERVLSFPLTLLFNFFKGVEV